MDYLGEIIAIGVDTAILLLCLRQYFKQKDTIDSIQGAPTYEITNDLHDLVKNSAGGKLPYVVLRGTVKCLENPIISKNSPNVVGAVQRMTISEHIITRASAGFWSEQTRPLHVSHNVSSFALFKDNVSVEVNDALTAEILDMDIVWDHYEPSQLGMLDHIWGFFSGVRQKGLQSTEEMLREGALITGIGELSSSNGKLVLQLPRSGNPLFLTTLTKTGLVFKLSDGQTNIRMICAFLGIVGIILCGLLTRKYLDKKEKERKDLRLRDRLEKSRRERRVAARDRNLSGEQLCIVCVHNPKE
uniref:RING-type E3 ubiquitin transferase n=1 Tax=Xenopsylla cheopis TaxID=163159 RepID=A0A6M2DS15_XENCH